MANVLFEYLFDRQAIGVAGKLSQMAYPGDIVNHRLSISLPALPSDFTRDVSVELKQGSLGTVVTGFCQNRKVCAKVIPAAVRARVRRDIEAVLWWASYSAIFNPSHLQMAREVERRLNDEMNLETEYRNGLLLHEVVQAHLDDTIRCVKPLSCSSETWLVTEYSDGDVISNLPRSVKHRAVMSMVSTFFELMLVHRVMLGDVNLGNFLWHNECLTLLDFGSVFTLNTVQFETVYAIHSAENDATKLESVLRGMGLSGEICNAIKAGADLMWSIEPQDFSELPALQNCILCPQTMGVQLDPQLVPCLRACCQIYQTLRFSDVKLALAPVLQKVLQRCDDKLRVK